MRTAVAVAVLVVVGSGCDTTIDRSGLRSVCRIALQQRTCVYGELPLVGGDSGAGSGRTDCRLFDGEKEIERSKYAVLPGPSELCDGANWHVELDVTVDIAPGNVFLVCRNDPSRRCPAPRTGGTVRSCRPAETTIVAPPQGGRGQFLVSLVGDETGGLLVWGLGEPGASREAVGAWLDANGTATLAGLPVAPELVRGLSGATMRDGVVWIPISAGDSSAGLGHVEVVAVPSLGPLDPLGMPVALASSLPFGEIDATETLDPGVAEALAPGDVRLAATGSGRLGATWIQGLVALGARSDEVYRTFDSSGAGEIEAHALGGVRPDAETLPVVTHDADGWGIAFAASYRVGATGTGFARLGDDGRASRAPRLAAGLVPSVDLAVAAGRDGSFVVAGLGDRGDVGLALFPREEDDVMAPVPVDRVQLGSDASFSPRTIALAPLGDTGDVLLAAVSYASAGPSRVAHELVLARVAPRTETVSVVGGASIPLGLRTSFNAHVCAASDGERVRVTWALDEGSGATVSSVMVEAFSLTDLATSEVERVDSPSLRVRNLACDGADGQTVAVWLTQQRWQAAWSDAMGAYRIEQNTALTDDEHLSVAMVPYTSVVLVGRRGRGYWVLEGGEREALTLPITDEPIATTLGPVALGARLRDSGDIEILAAADVLGAAGGSDRDVVAISARTRGRSIEDAGRPVLVSAHRGLPLASPSVTVEQVGDTERLAYLATLDVPGGSAIVVDRDVETPDGTWVASASTFTLGSATAGARVAAAIPDRDGIRILVDDPETAIVTTLGSSGSAPERTRELWTEESLLDTANCIDGRPFGLALTRVEGIELSAFAVLCTSSDTPVRVYVATADDRGVPLAPLDPQVPFAAGAQRIGDVRRAPPALAARVGDGLMVAFQNTDGDVVMRRFACEEP
ncbi:MAG: hypothetical protein IT379_23310 [Deltaproteobacteria bacterium]|nr:hypothetical protein [Deltaproteobacteria bacterium]